MYPLRSGVDAGHHGVGVYETVLNLVQDHPGDLYEDSRIQGSQLFRCRITLDCTMARTSDKQCKWACLAHKRLPRHVKRWEGCDVLLRKTPTPKYRPGSRASGRQPPALVIHR